MVTFLLEGNEQQHYLVANPRFKRVDVYDNNLQKVDLTQEQTVTKKETRQQDLADEGQPEKKNSQKKSTKKAVV